MNDRWRRMRGAGVEEEREKLLRRCALVGGVGGVDRRQEASPQPDDFHQRPAVGTREGVWADALPRRFRQRGPGQKSQPQRGQSSGTAPLFYLVMYLLFLFCCCFNSIFPPAKWAHPPHVMK